MENGITINREESRPEDKWSKILKCVDPLIARSLETWLKSSGHTTSDIFDLKTLTNHLIKNFDSQDVLSVVLNEVKYLRTQGGGLKLINAVFESQSNNDSIIEIISDLARVKQLGSLVPAFVQKLVDDRYLISLVRANPETAEAEIDKIIKTAVWSMSVIDDEEKNWDPILAEPDILKSIFQKYDRNSELVHTALCQIVTHPDHLHNTIGTIFSDKNVILSLIQVSSIETIEEICRKFKQAVLSLKPLYTSINSKYSTPVFWADYIINGKDTVKSFSKITKLGTILTNDKIHSQDGNRNQQYNLLVDRSFEDNNVIFTFDSTDIYETILNANPEDAVNYLFSEPVNTEEFSHLFELVFKKLCSYEIIYLQPLQWLYRNAVNYCNSDQLNRLANWLKWAKRLFVPIQITTYLQLINQFHIQRYLSDSKEIQEYGRDLIDIAYNYPSYTGRFFHILSEIQAILDNNNGKSPIVTQQNIIQLTAFADSSSPDNNLHVGQMIGGVLGILDHTLRLELKDTLDNYTPHPAFEPATLRLNGNDKINLFIIKNWQESKWTTINQYKYTDKYVAKLKEVESFTIEYNQVRLEKEKELLEAELDRLRGELKILNHNGIDRKVVKTIKVRPIGVSTGFYHTYYATENNSVIKICLNKSHSITLMDENIEFWQYLENDLKSIFAQAQEVQSTATAPDASEFAKINNPESMYRWIDARYPLEQSTAGNQNSIQLTWPRLLQIVKANQNSIWSELYSTIIWRVESLAFLASAERIKDNQELIRIMASKDKDPYYKICATLLRGVFSGDLVSNSHFYFILENIDAIQNQDLVAKKSGHPCLFVNFPDGGMIPFYYENYNPIDSSNLVCKGSDLEKSNQELYNLIQTAFSGGASVNINGRLVDRDEFRDYKIYPGDQIRMVGQEK